MEWLNKLVDIIHQHDTDYAQVDRSRTTWQLVSSSPGCIRKSYHNWPSLVSSLPEFAEMPCVAYTELVVLRVSVYFMSQWSSPCSVHRCCAWQCSYPALPNFVSNSSAPRKASTCFHTFHDSIIRSVDKPVQARILLLATSIPYSKCWYTAGRALCKLRMAFKQILADLTQLYFSYFTKGPFTIVNIYVFVQSVLILRPPPPPYPN